MIDCSGCKVAPERLNQSAFQRAGAGEERSSGRGIPDVGRPAGRGSKPAGFAHHAPRLGITVDRGAPADQACLHVTCQYQAVLGIEDGDELRCQTQGRIAARGDQTGSYNDASHDRGRREVTAGAKIDLALEAQVIERRIVPMREAASADPQGQAVREAQAGENSADQVVAGTTEGGLGDGCGHLDHSATGGRRHSPTLKPVTEPPAHLFLWRVPDREAMHPPLGDQPPALPRQPMKLDGPS